MIRPQVIPEPKRPEIEPEASVSGNVAGGGVEGGVVGGLVGGALGGAVTGLTAKVVETPSEPVEFNNSMTPPTKVFGPEPQYTQRALDYQVEGLMLVKCIVTRQGGLRNCRVLNSLPFMESAVLSALEQRRYRPALFQGKPIDVYYTFRIRLRLPR